MTRAFWVGKSLQPNYVARLLYSVSRMITSARTKLMPSAGRWARFNFDDLSPPKGGIPALEILNIAYSDKPKADC
jgi:hypothetical protein